MTGFSHIDEEHLMVMQACLFGVTLASSLGSTFTPPRVLGINTHLPPGLWFYFLLSLSLSLIEHSQTQTRLIAAYSLLYLLQNDLEFKLSL
jgi:hypothetical protein